MSAPTKLTRAILLGGALATPPAAESLALARASAPLGAGARLDLSLAGLTLRDVKVERSGFVASAGHVRVGLTGAGVRIEVRDGALARGAPRPPATSAPKRRAAAASPSPSPRAPSPAPFERLLRPPIPVELVAEGRADLGRDDVDTLAGTLTLRGAPSGAWRGEARLELSGPALPTPLAAPLTFGRDAEGDTWARGSLTLPEAPPLPLAARRTADTLRITLGDEGLGTLDVVARGDLGRGQVAARDLALAPFAALLPDDLQPRVQLARARVSGEVSLTRPDPGRVLMTLGAVEVRDLQLAHPRLSDRPVHLSRLELAGAVELTRRELHAQIFARHGDLQLAFETNRTPGRVHVEVELPETKCQALLDSAPKGLFPALRGMTLSGTIRAHARLALDPAAARGEAARARLEAGEEPGELAVELPFFESCRVTREPALVDASGLAGPYLHRFLTDGGRTRGRVLAPGEPAFVPLEHVPLLAAAFVTMEDTRFWRHDGFDRQQMRRAFWHNLAVGRIERGASTISQQTARNLWLGGKRNFARKVQEAVLAGVLERAVDKRRILEIYLNIIELGPEVYGVEEAARYHFGKAAADLSTLESLYLASLAPAPRTLSIRHHRDGVPKAWIARLHEQARRMALHGFIPWAKARAARRERLRLRKIPKTPA